jgi:ribosomal-protein-alanine N-acetyltransferase
VGGGAWASAATGLNVESVVIRPAGESDLDGILRIERDSFADPWSRESFESSLALDRMRFLVASDGGAESRSGESGDETILGYVVALLVLDEAEIADLAVAPVARRCGIGGLLLDRMVADASHAGVRSLYLEVRESNSAARALYESRSFLSVGRRRGYYQHPQEDALLLKRDFAPI